MPSISRERAFILSVIPFSILYSISSGISFSSVSVASVVISAAVVVVSAFSVETGVFPQETEERITAQSKIVDNAFFILTSFHKLNLL